MREVAEKLDSRLTSVEGHRGPDATSPAACVSSVEMQPGPALSSTAMEKPPGPDAAPAGVNGLLTVTPGRNGGCQPAPYVDPALGRTQDPPWSMVVKDGRRLKQVRLKQVGLPENSAHRSPTPRNVKTPAARNVRKKTGIIGTGVVSNILAVKTKIVKVFATKFDLNVDANTLSEYLKTKLDREVTCRKI